jgi:hypothetical protein
MSVAYVKDVDVDGPGLLDIVFTFRSAGSTSNPDLVRDGLPRAPGVVVTRAAAGEYEVTLPKVGGGYPQQVVGCICSLGCVDMTALIAAVDLKVAYKASSYSASTGKFRIMAILEDGTPAAEDLADNVEVHVHIRLQKTLGLKQP